jgi:hypothetical protein
MPMRLEGSCRCGAISFSVCLKSAGGGGYAINIMLLRDKASWVEPQIGPNDDCFEGSQIVDRGLAQKTRAVDQVIFSIHSQRLRQGTLAPTCSYASRYQSLRFQNV